MNTRSLPQAALRTTLALALVASLAACAARPPREALPQKAEIDGTMMSFGGTATAKNELTLTIDGEPAMRGSFSSFSPTLNLSADFKGKPVRSECYFASVLNKKGGRIGIIASAVQGGTGKASDTCKVYVSDKEAATLNF